MKRILVTLPKNRARLGLTGVLDGGYNHVTGPFPCLGKSDNAAAARAGNPQRDPLGRNGDTPTGTYRATLAPLHNPTPARLRTFGAHPRLLLTPIGGPALQAHRNGRRGLMIHGGALGPGGVLRPTHGCVRLSDDHMAALLRAVQNELPVMCEVEEK